MNHLLLILALFTVQDVPLKPSEEFDIKLDYNFRSRPAADYNTVVLGETPRGYKQRTSEGVLPYLILHVRPLKLPLEKMRVRVSNNRDDKALQRKVAVNTDIELDLGFTDDMKDRVTPHEYVLTFLDEEKAPVDKIVINIAEDGSFFVNGERRGKF